MRAPAAASPADVEVPVSTYLRAVARRWYVVAAGVVVALVAVLLNDLGNTLTSQTAAIVYLGQPVGSSADGATGRSTLETAQKLVASGPALRAASAASGIPVVSLRGRVAVHAVTNADTTRRTAAAAPMAQITLRGPWAARRAIRATNALARQLVAYTNSYQAAKARYLESRVAAESAQLARYREAERRARAQMRRATAGAGSAIDRVIAAAPYQAAALNAATRIEVLTTQLTQNRIDLAGTRQLQSAGFVQSAKGGRVSPATRRQLLVVGALVGALVGVLIALALDAAAALRGRAAATA